MTETLSQKATDWIEARGLDPEEASRMGWSTKVDKKKKEWIRIPYSRDGSVINNKYRKLDEKRFLNDKGTEHDLYNVDCLKDTSLDSEPLILCEGECDLIAIKQAGYQRVVSVPDGWTEKLEDFDGQPKFAVFKKNEEAINRAGKIIAVVDDDNTGHSLLRAVTNFFNECEVHFIKYPEGCKDPNDIVRLEGAESLAQAISTSKPIDPPGGLITGFSDMPPLPVRTVWRTGTDFLSNLFAMRSREVSVMTGTPGSGKTTFMTWAMHRLVKEHDIRIGVGLFETDPDEILDHLILLNGWGDREYMKSDELEERKKQLDRNYRLFHRVDDSENVHGVVWLGKMVHALAAREGCKVIIVDPYNELEHIPETGETVTAYTNWAIMKIRQMAEKYDVHICIVAHPKKMMSDKVKPKGYDIADSAAWYNKPGMGWTVHLEQSDVKGDHVTFTTWKVRSRKGTGCRPGFVRLEYDENTMVYRRLS